MPERRPATITQRTALFDDATRVVHDSYAEDLSLNEVARRIATSRRQLQRIYAEIGGTTFRDQLTGVRMQRAADLLSEQGRTLTVREVAARVGYRQPAQFAKAFRVHHGRSPSEYRSDALAQAA
jgi:AraC family transcriptional regulator, regulatory protein of adaptative response / methylphosphotriester-DNA alkyltransferase methyltransferase